nr:MAG TPA: hypothetical protein [Caudoviricetes sp.]
MQLNHRGNLTALVIARDLLVILAIWHCDSLSKCLNFNGYIFSLCS